MTKRHSWSGGMAAALLFLAASASHSQNPPPLPTFPRPARLFRVTLPVYGPNLAGPMTRQDVDRYVAGMARLMNAAERERYTRVLTADSVTLSQYITGSDANLAIMAADQTARRRDRQTMPALLARLADRRSAEASSVAAGALGQFGTPEALTGLRRALNDTRPSVRQRAALALAPYGDRAAIPALREALKSADDPYRLLAAQRLAGFNDRASVPAILKLADEMDYSSRRFAADALGKFPGDAAAQRRLRQMTTQEKYPGTRGHAARALGAPGNRSAVPTLLKALKDAYPDVRLEAANALAVIGDPSAVPALDTAAKESAPYAAHAGGSDRRARQAAAEAANSLRHRLRS